MNTVTVPHTVVLDTATCIRPELSVLIPSYKGVKLLRETLDSIVNQTVDFSWEIVICNDGSGDLTPNLFHDIPIPLLVIEFHDNIGYPGNLQRCFDRGRGDYLMLLGQDDIVASGYLQRIVDEFQKSPEIGAVTRSYYWFQGSTDSPVRAKRIPPHLRGVESIDVTVQSSFEDIRLVLDSLDQLSGLAFRRSMMSSSVGPDIFTAHIEPFIDIVLSHSVRFLCSYSIAVRVDSSQSRNVSAIYATSPAESWLRVSKRFSESLSRDLVANFICANLVGLFQIRNYSAHPFRFVLREAKLMILNRPALIFSPAFWAIFGMCIIIPRAILRRLVDRGKIWLFKLRPDLGFVALARYCD